jgi:hypothetical protein
MALVQLYNKVLQLLRTRRKCALRILKSLFLTAFPRLDAP